MNGKKKLALLLSLLLVLMMVPATAQAEEATVENGLPTLYLALGDSISFGLTDVNPITEVFGGGYAARFFMDTLLGNGYVFENLSYPGNTTQDLLDLVQSDEGMAHVAQADIITISIGSNNLLSPFIAAIAGMYDIELDPEDITGEDMLMELAQAIHDDYYDGNLDTPEMKLAALHEPLDDAFQKGTTQFMKDWSVIFSIIRKSNPDVPIYVNNLYNPLFASMKTAPGFEALYALVEKYIIKINSQIERLEKNGRFDYSVVNINPIFSNQSNFYYLSDPLTMSPLTAPVAFNLPLALAVAGRLDYSIALFPAFFAYCDPHPTMVGHQMIEQQLISAVS